MSTIRNIGQMTNQPRKYWPWETASSTLRIAQTYATDTNSNGSRSSYASFQNSRNFFPRSRSVSSSNIYELSASSRFKAKPETIKRNYRQIYPANNSMTKKISSRSSTSFSSIRRFSSALSRSLSLSPSLLEDKKSSQIRHPDQNREWAIARDDKI